MEGDGKRGQRKLPANPEDDDFADRIRRLRLELCMSVRAFATAFGFSPDTVLGWEHGKRPQGASIQRLQERTGKALDYFTGPLARSTLAEVILMLLLLVAVSSVACTVHFCPEELHDLAGLAA